MLGAWQPFHHMSLARCFLATVSASYFLAKMFPHQEVSRQWVLGRDLRAKGFCNAHFIFKIERSQVITGDDSQTNSVVSDHLHKNLMSSLVDLLTMIGMGCWPDVYVLGAAVVNLAQNFGQFHLAIHTGTDNIP